MDAETAELRVLEAARTLFNERGVQAVGMDSIRSASGVSLKRLYQVFPSKDALLDAVLRRRDAEVREAIAAHGAARARTPHEKVLAVFDYLGDWFAEPDFRGCAFINAYGELGAVSPSVADIARTHKTAVRDYFATLTTALGAPPLLADQLAILANGAMATAALTASPEPAVQAREAARVLLDAAARGD
ncbi:TetR/AcrR family transcriptional regulator [Streptomyces clavuligerus]|uniref:Transcriptional regulator, TetR family n=1 Tax=Streptomyces clavuligerus TaxID=1901 RepID=E2Q683_STRCL|nr:TetR/AcrR family transcriptional regulator [Streptomyces clavuligerus]ANW19916.1 TetR family transcriptional regulator [Streptomyces clavuligerus]AXU14535.1 TetR/AcrR family transcriptional regulator [Streptomyces clavuligerus]EFG07207.1 Transcriptional regulator, TetR family [Streptomyces clavuligerus]MBY6304547.1 TetR/AcrR family transcriptional regulator [Streptomyces clavuligerus]QCS07309.1 TetR/AcrR family transcriptional regulator [Streptomyces clavuligerus]